jgi:hypothetical protein
MADEGAVYPFLDAAQTDFGLWQQYGVDFGTRPP